MNISGAANWLDDKMPGWADKIDISTLDMNLGNVCVLGQLFRTDKNDYGGYRKGLSELDITSSNFYAEFSNSASCRDWIVQIEKRRNAKVVSVRDIRNIIAGNPNYLTCTKLNDINNLLEKIDPSTVTLTVTIDKDVLNDFISGPGVNVDYKTIRQALRDAKENN